MTRLRPPAERSSPEVDPVVLRDERLARLQMVMRAHDVECLLLFNEPNIRYATGASAMPVYAMSTMVRCALVPAEGVPILFEHANSIHRSAQIALDVRPMHAWEFYDDPRLEATAWARMIVDVMRELGVTGRALALDRLGTPGFLALLEEGLILADSAPVTQEARQVKTPEEILLFEENGSVIVGMLSAFEAAIAPGVTEQELLALNASNLLKAGGEYLATNTVCSGSNTNPWRAEATDRAIQAGDLVFVDTDAVTAGGAFFCVSRTFTCGEPSAAQRDTYKAAHEWLLGMRDLVRPGVTCAELAAKAPALPERYLPQRYECMVHGVGLEEGNPSVCYPQDPQSNPNTEIVEGMVLVVEVYAGEVGAGHGVKLGDQVRVTSAGVRDLAPYRYDATLLA